MVDALKTIHNLLLPEGRLIDLHPADRPSLVTIRSGTQTKAVGILEEKGGIADYQRAAEALNDVVQAKLFCWEEQREFDYTIVARSAPEMLTHLETKWNRAIVDENLRRAMELGMASAQEDKELLISQAVCIGRLRPVRH